MDQRPDYGPGGCCQPWAFGIITAAVGIGWGAVYLAAQLVRWVA